jgi:hypothetical protein
MKCFKFPLAKLENVLKKPYLDIIFAKFNN